MSATCDCFYRIKRATPPPNLLFPIDSPNRLSVSRTPRGSPALINAFLCTHIKSTELEPPNQSRSRLPRKYKSTVEHLEKRLWEQRWGTFVESLRVAVDRGGQGGNKGSLEYSTHFSRANTDLSTRLHSRKRNLIREKLNSFKCTSPPTPPTPPPLPPLSLFPLYSTV